MPKHESNKGLAAACRLLSWACGAMLARYSSMACSATRATPSCRRSSSRCCFPHPGLPALACSGCMELVPLQRAHVIDGWAGLCMCGQTWISRDIWGVPSHPGELCMGVIDGSSHAVHRCCCSSATGRPACRCWAASCAAMRATRGRGSCTPSCQPASKVRLDGFRVMGSV